MSGENPTAAHLIGKKKNIIDLHVFPSVRSGKHKGCFEISSREEKQNSFYTQLKIISHIDILFFTMLEYEPAYV